MPWSNQGGGGGPWGGGGGGNNSGGGNGGGGGPWGQGPRGPQGPQGQPPDLEDILRRGQDRLKNVLPGGGASSGPIILGAALLLGAFWLFQSIYTVQPDEQAVELRLGKPKTELSGPGLHFHWWPVETVQKVVVAEKLVPIGAGDRGAANSGLMLSSDQNIVDVKFSIAYQVADPRAYLFDVADPDGMLRQVGESAMREVVGRRPAEDIFRDNRQGIANDVRAIMQNTLDGYGAGLAINAVSIEDAAPPQPVADAFNEVQRAEQDESRFVEEANRDANQVLGKARGLALQIAQEAAAYKNRIVEDAKGESQRFISVYNEYAKAPEVTRQRMYLETMEQIYRDTNKIIMDEKGSGVVPYLPLQELRPRQQTSGQPGATSSTGSAPAAQSQGAR